MSKGPQTQICMCSAKWKCRNQVQKFGILTQKLERKCFGCLTNIPARVIHLVALFSPLIPRFQSKRFIVLQGRTSLCQCMVSLTLFLHAREMYLITNWSMWGDWCLYFPNRDLAESSGLHCLFLGLLHSAHSRIIFFFNLKISQNCLLGKYLKRSNGSPRWLQTLMVCCTNNGLSSICRS